MRLLLPLALATLAVPVALAQDEGRDAFTLVGHYDGRSYFWAFPGNATRNPTLVVPANATITVTFLNEGDGVHNIQVAGQPASGYVDVDHPEATYTFTAPASGSVEYWCQPHKASGMRGHVVVAGSEVEPARTSALPLVGALLALAGVALARRR